MRYFSMFTGIGGFELGIQRAFDNEYAHISEESEQEKRAQGRERPTDKPGVLLHNRDRTTPLCVGYSEIDKYAIQTYEKNFGKEIKNYGDATTINTAELPDFDLLVGGFPCQAFSVAGKRAGFNDARGTLIFDVVRILRDKRPRYFVLENVKGLLSHEGGKTFAHILEILTDSGYDVSWSIHNSKNYGVPQNRERIYLIGNLRGERRPQVFPVTIADGEDTQDIGQDVAYTIDANYHKGTNTLAKSRRSIVQLNQPTHSNDRVYADSGVSPTLNTMQGGNRQPFIAAETRTDGIRTFSDNTMGTLRTKAFAGDKAIIQFVPQIRRLTPTECERLQGFPDGWTIGSDTQRYKQCGNAVTVNVVEHVISELLAPQLNN